MQRIERQNSMTFYHSNLTDQDIKLYFANETFWITQHKMSELFGCDVREIFSALKELFKSGVLSEDLSNKKIHIKNADFSTYSVNVYDLDALLAVGYKLNPKETTNFRVWANSVLKSYFQKVYSQKTVTGGFRRRLSDMIAA